MCMRAATSRARPTTSASGPKPDMRWRPSLEAIAQQLLEVSSLPSLRCGLKSASLYGMRVSMRLCPAAMLSS